MKKITLFNDYNVDSKIYKIYKEEFYKKKNNSYYFPIFTIVGTVFVFALKNIPIGLCLGVVIGIALDYKKRCWLILQHLHLLYILNLYFLGILPYYLFSFLGCILSLSKSIIIPASINKSKPINPLIPS